MKVPEIRRGATLQNFQQFYGLNFDVVDICPGKGLLVKLGAHLLSQCPRERPALEPVPKAFTVWWLPRASVRDIRL